MSKTHVEMIKCPKCKKLSEMTVWDIIDVTDAPEMKQKIRNGEAFRWHCSECDDNSLIFFPTIYHQPGEKYIVSYVPGDPDTAEKCMKDLSNDNESGYNFDNGYTRRVVTDMNQLREKLVILDEGLDDRIIELMKLFIVADIQTSSQDLRITEIYFTKEKDDTYSFAIRFDNDKWGGTAFSKDNYDQVAKTFKTSLLADNEVIIDTEWAVEMLNKNM
ncbi:CpXC domain-containing protein [Ruminococcus flavefaciens]|uniref:CpXC motif protein n=1 Tax=Ruminococcus flavefaciens TaxID=1265 RepID=A0A315XSS0_RUMFL|nr:CpXC domain-containing protein [Ruminococcus flavefaciens]MBQ6168442.1 CpXC domain-containing protein [Ruminococcus sp.]PWJ09734.1 CpXC motif protein [Ruminococcus flavefaciens]SSA52233.1 CpXC protein [Ruminococcus flavefaciens]